MRKITLAGLTAHVVGGNDGRGGGDGPVVVLLHGFGAPGTDLVPLADEIPVPGVRFVFPMAPNVLDPYAPPNDAPRAWWMIDMQALQIAALTRNYGALVERKPEGIDQVRAQLSNFIGELYTELGVSAERTVLGGFSQGAMLSTDLVLRSDTPFAGLLILSGTMLTRSEWLPLMAARRGLPIVQSHGSEDPILPFALADELRTSLVAAGAELDWVPFRGGHGIPRPVLTRVGALLTRVFPEVK